MFLDTIFHKVCAVNAVFVTFIHREGCVGAHVESLVAFDYIFGCYDWAEIAIRIGNKVYFFAVEEIFLIAPPDFCCC